MMHILMLIYVAFLFVLLTPGILVSLPPRSSRLTTAITHGIIFSAVFYFTHKLVWYAIYT